MCPASVVIAGPNSALDHFVSAELLRNSVQLSPRLCLSAGGKGVNVARTLHTLHREAKVTTLLGGDVGAMIERLARREGLRLVAVPIAADSRIATICLSSSDGAETVLNEPGPEVTKEEWLYYCELTAAQFTTNCELFACIGSLPPSVPTKAYQDLLTEAHSHGLQTMVDTAGAALAAALTTHPTFVKVNALEASLLLGEVPVDRFTESDGRRLAKALRDAGTGTALVTLGERGIAVVGGQGETFTVPTNRPEGYLHSVGAGDAFTAAFVDASLNGASLYSAAQLATTIASTSTTTWRPGEISSTSQ